jgi:hypothetical protein
MMIFPPGSTSQSVTVQIVDDAGLAVTGLVAATFPAVKYKKAGNTAEVAISLSDLAAMTTAWTSGGVKESSGGYYRLDAPDAMFSTAAKVTLIGDASGKHLIFPPIEVQYANVGALTSAVQQTLAGLIRGYATFCFVNKAGNDTTGDGLTPATAYLTVFKATSTVAAFTAIIVGPGVYDEGTNTLTVPTDGALIGAGRDNTTIQAQTVSTGLAGAIVKPSTRCKITDLTIQGNAASGVSQVPLGVESFDPGFTNARFERLRVIADADGIYVSGSVCSFVAEDVQIDTNYDCFAFFSPVTCTLRRVSARALGPSGVSSGVTARALNNQSASSVINAYDCSFLAQDATTTTTGIENAAGGTIRLFGNTSVRASSATGTVKDIISGNNVTAAGSVVYDAAKLTGTVTAAGAPAQDYARLLNPTSTLNLSNTTVGTLTTYTGNTPQTGDAYARVGAPAGASVSADIAAVKTDSGAINGKLPASSNATLTSLAAMISTNAFTAGALVNSPTGGTPQNITVEMADA